VTVVQFVPITYNDPVNGTQAIPKDLAFLFNDRWDFEDGLEDLKIHGLHSNIEVHD
jgi:hypothetical protein